ncbi:hypothetical protein AQI88_28195 [Streptomyces cellostaticus]|uniref:Uncharacterized protein n=1 Tax=Streptomyces cellostaticus TaxID=67285 RepID=A0A101NGW6_9ACTN|nr:hypothetical protein [Streptomyces cellostaticus]KUM93011.1 hypothetical protein AQI88_28195 [Streptomyces cellostaticus]GHI06027.1 hypothetical protein Scel_43480 [Streptomyces cellostaticus]
MAEIVVVYEVEKAVAARAPGGEEPSVRRVHAVPAAPGTRAAPGPRTLCGKDTFAMEPSRWKPAEHPEAPWYPEAYASAVCPDCDAVMEV